MQLYQKDNKMKNLIIGLILGFVLTSPFQVKAYNDAYTEWQQDVIDLLEEVVDHGEDISSDTQTLIDSVNRLPQG